MSIKTSYVWSNWLRLILKTGVETKEKLVFTMESFIQWERLCLAMKWVTWKYLNTLKRLIYICKMRILSWNYFIIYLVSIKALAFFLRVFFQKILKSQIFLKEFYKKYKSVISVHLQLNKIWHYFIIWK